MRSKYVHSMLKVVQTLRTESGMDFKGDAGSSGLYLQHIFKNQPWLLRESGETARKLHAHRLIMLFVNSAHIFTYTKTTQQNLRAVVGLPW